MFRIPDLGYVSRFVAGALSVLVLLGTACADSGSPHGDSAAGSVEDIAHALREQEPLVRARRLIDALEALSPEQAPAAFDAYEEARFAVDAADVALFAGWWAGHDADAAFEAFASSKMGGGSVGAEAVIRIWMLEQPTAALLAVEGAEVAAERKEEFIHAVVRGWYESGRAGVWTYVQSLQPGFSRQRLVTSLMLRKLRDEGIEETIEFINAAPDADGRFKRNLFHRAAGVIARKDLERAVKWSDEVIDDPNGGSLGRIVGAVWVQKGEPSEAMEWLIARPQRQWGHVAVRESYRLWIQQDRDAALAWAAQAEPTPAFEPVMEVYAVAIARDDTARGIATLERIHDAARREKATIRLARRWVERDPEAAVAWIETLPDDLVETIKSGQPLLPDPLMP
jgi:hypothetical protein